MTELKFAEILRRNEGLRQSAKGRLYEIRILSNVVTHQFAPVLEYALRIRGVNANISEGSYDNIVQNSLMLDRADLVVVMWELANMAPGLAYRAETMEPAERRALVEKLQSDVATVLTALRRLPLVVVSTFSDAPFAAPGPRTGPLGQIAAALNETLRREAHGPILTVQVDQLYADLSIGRSVDRRAFAMSKALYSVDFFKSYAEAIAPIVFSTTGRGRKALIFDGDNTLWHGIVGEDGLDGVEIGDHGPPGIYYYEVQCMAKALAREGVIIGLCSKNNLDDVTGLLAAGRMPLRAEDIAIARVNWNDKASNLLEIARALNIGLDSIVFVDDSPFETNLVRERLPAVEVVEVPKRLEDYAPLMRRLSREFFSLTRAEEDGRRAQMLRDSERRDATRAQFERIEDYIRSLRLCAEVFHNASALVPRIAQLTQKTNQFNLTSRRYSEAEIARMMSAGATHVFALSVSDRFGEYGVTGVCIAVPAEEPDTYEIDTLLLSCRILGRNLERVFLEHVLNFLFSRSVTTVRASFHPTPKNAQAVDFFEHAGFSVVEKSESYNRYQVRGPTYESGITYITVRHGNQD